MRAWQQPQMIAQGFPYGVGTDVDLVAGPAEHSAHGGAGRSGLPAVRSAQGIDVDPAFLLGRAPLTIPAHTKAVVLFDQSFETNAYPQLRLSGGKGEHGPADLQ